MRAALFDKREFPSENRLLVRPFVNPQIKPLVFVFARTVIFFAACVVIPLQAKQTLYVCQNVHNRDPVILAELDFLENVF